MKVSDQNGGIVIGWIVKLLIGLAIVGAAAFEAGAVVLNRVAVDTVGIDAAREGALEYGRTRSTAKAKAVVERYVKKQGAELLELSVSNDREKIRVSVRREAATLFIDRVGPLKKYTIAESTHHGRVQ